MYNYILAKVPNTMKFIFEILGSLSRYSYIVYNNIFDIVLCIIIYFFRNFVIASNKFIYDFIQFWFLKTYVLDVKL